MDFAAVVERELALALDRPEPGTLRHAAAHLCLAPAAKRARPLLVQRFAALVGVAEADAVRIAVAAELIHSASLLHDDVVDGSALRRGRPSANEAYGNRVAVLAGDLLIALALDRLRPLPNAVTAAAVESIAAMTRAAMLEIEAAFDPRLDAARWDDIARGKTGALLAFCGRAAAEVAGAERAVDAFAAGGLALGVAFQARDDLWDLEGGAGKPRFADLRAGAPNLVLALACAEDAAVAAELGALWRQEADEAAVRRLGERVLVGRGPALARERISREVEEATRALGPWLEGPEGEQLLAWGRALLGRDT